MLWMCPAPDCGYTSESRELANNHCDDPYRDLGDDLDGGGER